MAVTTEADRWSPRPVPSAWTRLLTRLIRGVLQPVAFSSAFFALNALMQASGAAMLAGVPGALVSGRRDAVHRMLHERRGGRLPNAIEALKRQAQAIGSAPIALAVLVVLVTAIVWGIMHWAYGGILTSKDAHIASLERRVADYRDSVSGASPEDARRRIDALETQLHALQLQLTPRRLNPAQRQAISDHSRRPAGSPSRNITVTVDEACGDCAAFAAEITEALRVADNWTVDVRTVSYADERLRSGLGIRVAEPTRPSPEAVVLQQALTSAGVSFSMLGSGPSSGVELLVTERAH